MEEIPPAKFQQETNLIDILWRQDVDLGVEREIFDGCLRQREEEARRARERHSKTERELERIMQRLQKLDKETGEFLPCPSPENSQAVPFSAVSGSTVSTQPSPITQNPLLSALLFSKSQKPPAEEHAFNELLSLPDLQYYLDLLESENPNLPVEDVTELYSQTPSEPQREPSSTDVLHCLSELTQTISDSITPHVAQIPSHTPSDPVETCIQTFPNPGNPTHSPSNTVFSPSPPENLNQMSLTQCQLNSSQLSLSEFCPELTNTYTVPCTHSQPELSVTKVGFDTPHTLSQSTDSPVLLGFEDSASVGSVDLDTSLYSVDNLSNSQSDEEEMENVQSDYIDLLPALSLHSEAMEATLYETVTFAQDRPKDHAQNESPEYSQHVTKTHIHTETRSNIIATSRAEGVRRLCRDEQRARALGLPLSVHDIINLPVDVFNEAVSSCKLNHAQLNLIRDIRRRGKNKMAAQSCRKRKLDSLVDLETEIDILKNKKEQMMEEKEQNTRDLRETTKKLKKLYNEVFRKLKDEHGNSYNPKEYTLQLSTDGTVYLLPRGTADRKNTLTEDLTLLCNTPTCSKAL